jgi:predicted dehydrogenase
MIDVLIGLLGMPTSAFAKVRTLVQAYEVEDTADFLLTLPGDVAVTGSFHWGSKSWGHDMEIVGSEGRLIWSPYDTGKVVTILGRDRREEDLPNAANVHGPLVEDFVDAVLIGRAPGVPVSEAAKTNAVLDAIYRSGETGKDVAP